jgi:hypothetical protein
VNVSWAFEDKERKSKWKQYFQRLRHLNFMNILYVFDRFESQSPFRCAFLTESMTVVLKLPLTIGVRPNNLAMSNTSTFRYSDSSGTVGDELSLMPNNVGFQTTAPMLRASLFAWARAIGLAALFLASFRAQSR